MKGAQRTCTTVLTWVMVIGDVGQDLVPTKASIRPEEKTETKDLVNTNDVGRNKKYKQVKISILWEKRM